MEKTAKEELEKLTEKITHYNQTYEQFRRQFNESISNIKLSKSEWERFYTLRKQEIIEKMKDEGRTSFTDEEFQIVLKTEPWREIKDTWTGGKH